MYQKLGFVVAKAAVFDIGNGFVTDDYVMELAIGQIGEVLARSRHADIFFDIVIPGD